jgi:PTS system nitrogen regulatory IIA component
MYLNVIELAESFGVEESMVEDWVRKEGLPCVPDRGRLLFDRAQVVAWAAQRGRAAKAGFLASGSAGARERRRLEPMLRQGGIWRNVGAAEVPAVLEKVVQGAPGVTPVIRQLLVQRLRSPQGITWAPVGRGLALPHLRAPVALGPQSGALAFLFLREPWPLSEPPPDAEPICRLLFFIAPSPRAHLEMLGLLSTALSRGNLRSLVQAGAPDEEICAVLRAADEGCGGEAAR